MGAVGLKSQHGFREGLNSLNVSSVGGRNWICHRRHSSVELRAHIIIPRKPAPEARNRKGVQDMSSLYLPFFGLTTGLLFVYNVHTTSFTLPLCQLPAADTQTEPDTDYVSFVLWRS